MPSQCDAVHELQSAFAAITAEQKDRKDRKVSPDDDAERLLFALDLDAYDLHLASAVDDPTAPLGRRLRLVRGRLPAGGRAVTHALMDEAWTRSLNISRDWIGGTDPETGVVRRVRLKDVLDRDTGAHWTHPGVAEVPLKFYDPQQIWEFVGAARYCLAGAEADPARCPAPWRTWVESHELTPETLEVLQIKNGKEKRGTVLDGFTASRQAGMR